MVGTSEGKNIKAGAVGKLTLRNEESLRQLRSQKNRQEEEEVQVVSFESQGR